MWRDWFYAQMPDAEFPRLGTLRCAFAGNIIELPCTTTGDYAALPMLNPAPLGLSDMLLVTVERLHELIGHVLYREDGTRQIVLASFYWNVTVRKAQTIEKVMEKLTVMLRATGASDLAWVPSEFKMPARARLATKDKEAATAPGMVEFARMVYDQHHACLPSCICTGFIRTWRQKVAPVS